ncbi:MAG: nicotinamide riboside transporter PnuC [Rickettsiales bacterium]|jgi:nicotinamide mononucleotide transporter|nr:nicotinamide riboside transporter PnuC [Rickettsiales bacterium]
MILDIFISIFGILYLLLLSKNKREAWITFALYALLMIFKTYKLNIYANMFVNTLILVMSIINYIKWSNIKTDTNVKISFLTKKEKVFYLSMILCVFFVFYIILIKFINGGNSQFMDAFGVTFSITAMPLLKEKKIEGWLCYVFSDITKGFLFLINGAYIISVLCFFFTILDVNGFLKWKNKKGTY